MNEIAPDDIKAATEKLRSAICYLSVSGRSLSSEHILELGSDELSGYREHISRLDRGDLYMRFSGYMTSQRIESYVATLMSSNTTVLALYVNDSIRGAVEIHAHHTDKSLAEFAFSVEKAYQGHGFGSMLMDAAITFARSRNIVQAEIICSPENERMRRLARRFTNNIERLEDDMIITIDTSFSNVESMSCPAMWNITSSQITQDMGRYI